MSNSNQQSTWNFNSSGSNKNNNNNSNNNSTINPPHSFSNHNSLPYQQIKHQPNGLEFNQIDSINAYSNNYSRLASRIPQNSLPNNNRASTNFNDYYPQPSVTNLTNTGKPCDTSLLILPSPPSPNSQQQASTLQPLNNNFNQSQVYYSLPPPIPSGSINQANTSFNLSPNPQHQNLSNSQSPRMSNSRLVNNNIHNQNNRLTPTNPTFYHSLGNNGGNHSTNSSSGDHNAWNAVQQQRPNNNMAIHSTNDITNSISYGPEGNSQFQSPGKHQTLYNQPHMHKILNNSVNFHYSAPNPISNPNLNMPMANPVNTGYELTELDSFYQTPPVEAIYMPEFHNKVFEHQSQHYHTPSAYSPKQPSQLQYSNTTTPKTNNADLNNTTNTNASNYPSLSQAQSQSYPTPCQVTNETNYRFPSITSTSIGNNASNESTQITDRNNTLQPLSNQVSQPIHNHQSAMQIDFSKFQTNSLDLIKDSTRIFSTQNPQSKNIQNRILNSPNCASYANSPYNEPQPSMNSTQRDDDIKQEETPSENFVETFSQPSVNTISNIKTHDLRNNFTSPLPGYPNLNTQIPRAENSSHLTNPTARLTQHFRPSIEGLNSNRNSPAEINERQAYKVSEYEQSQFRQSTNSYANNSRPNTIHVTSANSNVDGNSVSKNNASPVQSNPEIMKTFQQNIPLQNKQNISLQNKQNTEANSDSIATDKIAITQNQDGLGKNGQAGINNSNQALKRKEADTPSKSNIYDSHNKVALPEPTSFDYPDSQAEINDFYRNYVPIKDSYTLIAKVGEGAFSTVFKAIDKNYNLYDNPWDNGYSQSVYFKYREEERSRIRNLVKDAVAKQKESKTGEDFVSKVIPPKYVAIKRIHVTTHPRRISLEITLLTKLTGSPNLLPLITADRYQDQVIVVMPYFEHHDFRDFYDTLSLQEIRVYFKQLFNALAFIHEKKIIHRDVKNQNFLYNLKTHRGVLVDFGLAESAPETNSKLKCDCRYGGLLSKSKYASSSNSKLSFGIPFQGGKYKRDSRPARRFNRAGTRGFRAPEVLFCCTDQTTKIDVWSAGIMLLSFLTKKCMFFQAKDDSRAIIEMATIFGKRKMKACALLHGAAYETNIPTISEHGYQFEQLIKWCLDAHYNEIMLADSAKRRRKEVRERQMIKYQEDQHVDQVNMENPESLTNKNSHSSSQDTETDNSSKNQSSAESAEKLQQAAPVSYTFDTYTLGCSQLPSDTLKAIDFLKNCLELDYRRRYTATQALNHPFLKNVRLDIPIHGEKTRSNPNCRDFPSYYYDGEVYPAEYRDPCSYYLNQMIK